MLELYHSKCYISFQTAQGHVSQLMSDLSQSHVFVRLVATRLAT